MKNWRELDKYTQKDNELINKILEELMNNLTLKSIAPEKIQQAGNEISDVIMSISPECDILEFRRNCMKHKYPENRWYLASDLQFLEYEINNKNLKIDFSDGASKRSKKIFIEVPNQVFYGFEKGKSLYIMNRYLIGLQEYRRANSDNRIEDIIEEISTPTSQIDGLREEIIYISGDTLNSLL